ncbi:MAG: DUF6249 domain-containing protein, partial [Gammaproteobacteria bacterium]
QAGDSGHIPNDIAAELSRSGIHIEPGESNIVPVIAILSVFGTPVLITGIIVLGWYQRQKRRMSLMEKIVESGQPIPEELLNNAMDQGKPGTSLKKGVTSLGLGAGVIIFGFFVSETLMAIGAIPLCMGLAYLLLWKLEDKSSEDSGSI